MRNCNRNPFRIFTKKCFLCSWLWRSVIQLRYHWFCFCWNILFFFILRSRSYLCLIRRTPYTAGFKKVFIGNMGNPVITRLGRSQMWYRKWYTDFKYSSNVKLLKTFNDIVKAYFTYGLFFNTNTFINTFWYKNIPHAQTKISQTNLYFRRYFYAHHKLTIEHTYLIRNTTSEYFSLRIYILKYSNWLILSVQWFKPVKHKKNNSTTQNQVNLNRVVYKTPGKYKPNTSRRLKVVLTNLVKILNTNNLKYLF